jgi:PAB-dependent poly(A)-specific ribonuclease subunit 2
MSISPHGDYLALGDSDGQVHLMTSHDLSEESEFIGSDGSLTLPTMNGFEGGVSVDWPDVPGNPPDIQWKERT